ncbi:hypothetical protein Trydic_g1516 [Trypoxylus dichotomus]
MSYNLKCKMQVYNCMKFRKRYCDPDLQNGPERYQPETVEWKRGGEVVARNEDELMGLRGNGHERRKSRQNTLSPAFQLTEPHDTDKRSTVTCGGSGGGVFGIETEFAKTKTTGIAGLCGSGA